jgi:hypothetical protein
MTSGRTRARIQVDVVATSPSISSWFEYTSKRTIDI